MTKIAFEIPQTGLLYQGVLYSKRPEKPAIKLKHKESYKRAMKKILHRQNKTRKETSDWQYQSAVTQYRLVSNSGEIQSPPISMYATQDSEWKLVLNQPKTLLPEQVPAIKIAWKPVFVTFLAQGKGPFQLYYGNSKTRPLKVQLPYLPDNQTVEKVSITDINAVDKAQDSRPLKAFFSFASDTWQKALLWVLLCLGVILMTFMVFRLFNNIASGKQ